ncbi:WD repeat-containing protein WRAP73 [Exaiptasia diaphana]|uniref:WD repeat-containing protein WRAP73 n=1 Tax=Exaiptasia diaphana TaxID=2652724 RepID=A0A913X0X4_EXADI|nr:WD repeat-containing protein WRAP73 [Exaiptasia diaphana]KXJ16324.1 WD repeat-containing protein WRAP73 [Exaiptasia diaphana]
MNFSELFKQSGQLCKFSPNGRYLANCVGYRLIVRDVQTLQILQLYTCLDNIQNIEWSSDSLYIMCAMHKRALIQVWSLEKPDWTCKIDEGSAGLAGARWSPDGRHILTTADFQLRITIWSLVSKSVSYIKYPKHASEGLDFSRDGKYMALAERRNCKDFVSIFTCDSWQLLKHFEVETKDLASLSWSPDGRVLCIWDSITQYKLFLYSVDGRCLAYYSAYEFALGIKTVTWSPSSQFLAIGSFDQKCRVLNHITWKVVAEHNHPNTLDTETVVVYKEIEVKPPLLQGDMMPPGGFTVQSKYQIEQVPVQVPSVKLDPEKHNPKLGIGYISFSNDNKYMATINDNMPNVLWIWDVPNLCLAVLLLQSNPIKAVYWDPLQPRLALCTNNNKLYLWSPAGCVSVVIPSENVFQATSLKWHPDGNSLVILSKDHLCLCFLSDVH